VEDASALLEAMRADSNLPALAGVAIMGGRTVARGAAGVRKEGDPTPVTVKDQFHLGSCTKAMTAHLCALLLEQGSMKRETRLAEALPEMAAAMHEAYRDLTLDHLLSHRSGFPNESWLKGRNFSETRRFGGTPKEQREAYVRAILQEAPDAKAGERFIYSNRNFALAGHLAERAAGAGWEELLQERVFKPLQITSAGYGAMGSPGLVEQPWQHLLEGKRRVAIRPGPAADNPPAIGPGGTVHMALEDWARFVQDHLDGIKGRPAHLKPASYQYLHTPPFGGTYMGGWGVAEREWGGGRVFTHSGSNTQNFAVVWMAPERNLAVLSATNQGGVGAEKACDRVASKFIGTYLVRSEPQV
jgi:CubicO group peptidase (beta-lactamase class C family)